MSDKPREFWIERYIEAHLIVPVESAKHRYYCVVEKTHYDALAAENERLRAALERISKGQECSACSCECHAIAMGVLKK